MPEKQWPVLMVDTGPEAGNVFVVGTQPLLLGRAPEADIKLSSLGVSQRHARVENHAGRVVVEDLGSTNGTWLDGHRVEGLVDIRPGACLQVGDTKLHLEVVTTAGEGTGPVSPSNSYGFGSVGGPVVAGTGNRYAGRDQYEAGRDLHHGNRVNYTADYDPWDEIFQGRGPGRLMMIVG